MVKINLNDNDKTEINNYYFNFNPIPKVKQQNSGYLWQLYQFNSYFKVLNKIIIPYLIVNWLAKNFVDFIFSTKSITLSLKINSIEKQQSQLWWNTFLYIRFQEINGRGKVKTFCTLELLYDVVPTISSRFKTFLRKRNGCKL